MNAANRVLLNHPHLKDDLINRLNQINKANSNRIIGLIKVSLAHLLIMHLKFRFGCLNSWYPPTKYTQRLEHHEVT